MAWVACLAGVYAVSVASGEDTKTKRAVAVEGAKPDLAAVPYLGPGADKLSKDEYLRVYSQYIKESIRMGFPPRTCVEGPCEQGIAHLFSAAGLFTYPLPSGADVKSWKNSEGTLECYESGGTVAQVQRESGKALLRALAVHSKSPQAAQSVARACKEGPLKLERDGATGLERLAGIPVGYPHPLLCPESQGLIVRRLDFSGDRTGCRPTGFDDNSWVSQLRLSEESCGATLSDLQQTLSRKIAPTEFAKRERERQRARMRASVKANGGNAADADALWKRYYGGPIGHDVTMVGQAMRNVENCNQFQIGQTASAPAGGKTGAGGPTIEESSRGRGSKGR